MASPIYLQKKARRGPTFREALLMHAVGRIAYHGFIDNIQASWVKIGLEGAKQLLVSGCNDMGGTLIDENISRAAGATHGQRMQEADFRDLAESASDAPSNNARPSTGESCPPAHVVPAAG